MARKPAANSPAEEALESGAVEAAEEATNGAPASGDAPDPDQNYDHPVVHRSHAQTAPFQP